MTITAPLPQAAPAARPLQRARAIVGAAVVVLIVAVLAVLADLGSEQMRRVAPLGSVDHVGRVVKSYGWSAHPAGFTLRYHDGTSETRLWW